ncbi:hypothetical protein [Pseudomonas sp. MGal98]|uniref:hypothetical protein n=1 Tax=Pseudomonas sp. MGal98 TaxID=3162460 RepID=UPI0032EF3730
MSKLIGFLLLIVGVIHLLPLVGVLGGERLNALYGLSFNEPNLHILMRHRAVLFGLLGGLLVAAAFLPSLRAIALVGGLISVLSFLLLALGRACLQRGLAPRGDRRLDRPGVSACGPRPAPARGYRPPLNGSSTPHYEPPAFTWHDTYRMATRD